ncbi:MAG: uroporphyrinogen-III synthase, partial [Coriobacteriia bacterium]|nr:uroporphyrinogen-III synthase [Coriobacteriia bacterium]
ELDNYEWIIFTSANAVDHFFQYVHAAEQGDISAKTAVVGPATAEALKQQGMYPDLLAQQYQAEGLVQAFQDMGDAAARLERILIPRALEAREILPEELARLGYEVTIAPVYQTVCTQVATEDLAQLDNANGIVFTSSSTARHFIGILEAAGMDALGYLNQHQRRVFSIGPVTTDELVHSRINPANIVQADEATATSLTDAIITAL